MPRVRRRPRNLRQQRAAPENVGSRAKLHEMLGIPPGYDWAEEYPYPVMTAYRERIGWKPSAAWGGRRTPTTTTEDTDA